MAEKDEYWRRRAVELSRPGGEGRRGTSGDFNPSGTKHNEYWSKKVLEEEQTLTPVRHVSSPQGAEQAATSGPGSAMGQSDRVTERISIHNVDTDTRFSDRRRGPRTYDDEHSNQRDLAGHTAERTRGTEKPDKEKRLESTRRTRLSED